MTKSDLPSLEPDPQTSKTILAAIGGKEFMNKIGATDIAVTLPALSFNFPQANGVNCCSIAFRDGKYHMALAYRFGWRTTVKARYTDLAANDLATTFLTAIHKEI